jgi:hypothetical protein
MVPGICVLNNEDVWQFPLEQSEIKGGDLHRVRYRPFCSFWYMKEPQELIRTLRTNLRKSSQYHLEEESL